MEQALFLGVWGRSPTKNKVFTHIKKWCKIKISVGLNNHRIKKVLLSLASTRKTLTFFEQDYYIKNWLNGSSMIVIKASVFSKVVCWLQ